MSIGPEVVSDPVDVRHAEIIGAPLRDDDEGLATYYADLLAEQARLIWKRAFPNHLLERKRRLSEKLCRAE